MAISTAKFRICDVHRLLDHDTEKHLCNYCSLCDAWICVDDATNWNRRIKAALKRKLEFGYQGIPNYEEIVLKGGPNGQRA